MNRILSIVCGVLFSVSFLAVGTAEAQYQQRGASQGNYRYVQSGYGHSNRTAQGVANMMASQCRVGHFGGNPGYEGCGSGSSPAAAYNVCCYSRSGMRTVDVGYAQGRNGMWYCCRRYR